LVCLNVKVQTIYYTLNQLFTEITKKYVNQLAYKIVGCAIEVHKELGPGLLESLYEKCLVYELMEKGLKVTSQQQIIPLYKGIECKSKL